ncbi:MAG: AI-2E family transporter [Sphingobacteriaceae bacterium]|nr:MAG: AI-2E family transporter [Sphingobacteriaceae bacterium]
MAKLQRSVLILLFLFLAFGGLYFAQEFLVPLAIAAVLAMLFIGFSNYLESKGMNRAFSALVSVFILVASVSTIILLLSIQLSDFAADFDMMKKKLTGLLFDIKNWVHQSVGLTVKQQDELLKQGEGTGAQAGSMAAAIAGSIMSITVNIVLGLVYMYLLLYNRSHIKKFFIKLSPDEDMIKTDKVIHEAATVAQKYLSGLGTMIVMLWILYGIGFSFVGVENAIFFAVLCGILEIVPFIGNITGTSITVLAVIAQGGNNTMIIGVVCTYFLIQFVQTYIIEPLVVGEQVSINPLFTIMSIVVGEMVWGIPGMILAIPVLGIIKIICDNVPQLKPYGYLIGSANRGKKTSLTDRIKGWFTKS